MTDKNNNNLDLDAALVNTQHKVEDFFTKNKKNLVVALIAIVAIIGGYIGMKKFVIEPKEAEAQSEIFRAQYYFEIDSFALALKGDGKFKGFADIASEYSGTKAGNLANYYAGICLLRTGDYAGAIESLKDFSTDNEIIGPLAAGLLGDAYVETQDLEKGASQYLKAARLTKNKLTAPVFFKKAGVVYEELGQYGDAVDAYKSIKTDYPDAQEAQDIDKYISRAAALKEAK
jgi:TolA-binding protein